MENQTRFDLNAAIENWRQELAAQLNLTADVRRELETHLRDSITGFQQRGLNDEECFWLACKRVGHPQQLGEEFVKANPTKIWRERASWILASIIAFESWGYISSSLYQLLVLTYVPKYLFQSGSLLLNLLLQVLPVVWIIILIAKGKITRLFAVFSLLFRSKLCLGSVCMLLLITSHFLSCFMHWWELWSTNTFGYDTNGKFDMDSVITVWKLDLSSMIGPLILVGLLVWLLPTKNKMISHRLQVQ